MKTQAMCDKAVPADPLNLRHVLDKFKTKELCEKAVENHRKAM